MKKKLAVSLICLVGLYLSAAPAQHEQDWSNYVRIGAYGLKGGDADEIVRRAQESGVFGIEVDNDIPGRYESFLRPEEKLAAIRAVAFGNNSALVLATECGIATRSVPGAPFTFFSTGNQRHLRSGNRRRRVGHNQTELS